MKERLHRLWAGIIRLQKKPMVGLVVLVFVAVSVTAFISVSPAFVGNAVAQEDPRFETSDAGDPTPAAATTPAATGETQSSISVVDRIALLIAGLALFIAQAIGQIIVALMSVIIIPLMMYNGFASSTVVGAGWAIIRDTVNMFFVIILIVIAMGTVFGVQRFNWQKQVTKLMLFAIVINFSRLICGLMIDIAQVIMLTFAYALKDIAGGNFVQLFGLADILTVDPNSGPISAAWNGTSSAGIKAFDILAAAIAANFMMIAVFVCLLFLAIILAYRIVMLWVLVTLAPLAWFFGGVGDLVKTSAYASWWKNFTCYTVIGPVVTFFLWLTLAVAGAGSIGATFDQPAAGQVSNSILQSLDTTQLTSFIIGIAMLFAGFQAAQEVCQGAQGAVSGLTSSMAKYGGGAAALPITMGTAAGAWAARKTGRQARETGWGLAAKGLGAAAGNRFMPTLAAGAFKSGQVRAEEKKRTAIDERRKEQPKVVGAERQTEMAMLGRGQAEFMKNPETMKKIYDASGGKTDPQAGIEGLRKAFPPAMLNELKDANPDEYDKMRETYPALFGKDAIADVENEEDLKKAKKVNWDDSDFFEKAKTITVEIKGKDKETGLDINEPMSLEKAYSSNPKLLNKDLREKYERGLKAHSPEAIAARQTGAIDVRQLTAKAGKDADGNVLPATFSPQVAARLVGEGSKAQMQGIAANPDLKNALGEAETRKKVRDSIDSNGNAAERMKARSNLALALGSELPDPKARATAVRDAYGIVRGGPDPKNPTQVFGGGPGAADNAKADFRAAAKKDQSLLDHVDFRDHDSPVAQAGAAAMNDASFKALLDQFQMAGTKPEKMDVAVKIEDILKTNEAARGSLKTKIDKDGEFAFKEDKQDLAQLDKLSQNEKTFKILMTNGGNTQEDIDARRAAKAAAPTPTPAAAPAAAAPEARAAAPAAAPSATPTRPEPVALPEKITAEFSDAQIEAIRSKDSSVNNLMGKMEKSNQELLQIQSTLETADAAQRKAINANAANISSRIYTMQEQLKTMLSRHKTP